MRSRFYLVLVMVIGGLLVLSARSQAQGNGTPRAYLPLVAQPQAPAATPIPPTATTQPGGQPTPTTQPQTGTAWLDYLNSLRALANLPALTEDPVLSDGDLKHAIYMVKNDVIAHSEDTNLPFYTDAGNTAAARSNVMVSSSESTSDESALNGWMVGPFHALGMIDPALQQVGFGSFREAGSPFQMAAALNVIDGLGSVPPEVTFPVLWPADGKTSWLKQYNGGESPDPLSACTGYATPTGAPLYMLFGSGTPTPQVTASSLKRGATDLDVCVYTGGTYTNPDGGQQNLARIIMSGRGAVVIIPRDPLIDGTYTVSMTVDGQQYDWTFTVGPQP